MLQASFSEHLVDVPVAQFPTEEHAQISARDKPRVGAIELIEHRLRNCNTTCAFASTGGVDNETTKSNRATFLLARLQHSHNLTVDSMPVLP